MAQMIRFTKTSKDDVTVGKFYEVKNVDTGNGYYFDDDAGDERYVCRSGSVNAFEVYDDVQTKQEDTPITKGFIRFTRTQRDGITVGKLYEITHIMEWEDGCGYRFHDNFGNERYADDEDADDFETFHDFDSAEDAEAASDPIFDATEPNPDPDGVVCIDFIDGYVAHFHDVDSFDIEERVGITLVVITDTEGGKTLIPFDRVRKMRLLHLHDGADE